MVTNFQKVFPIELPGSEWVEFKADGFSKPVTGTIFRDGSVERGVPLGGLGTGFIALCTDGTLDYYSTIFSAFTERELLRRPGASPQGPRGDFPTLRLPFLGLAVGGKTWLLSLKDVEGVERARQINYWGHYPVADLEYESDAPVSVSLRAWAQFYPGDAVSSNVPGAVFQVQLRNESEETQPVSLGFSFHGPRHEELACNAFGKSEPLGQQPVYQRQKVEGDFTGVSVDTTWEGFPYGYALGVIGGNEVRIGGEVVGTAWSELAGRLPDTAPTDSGASVVTDFSLEPKETRTVYYVLSWYAPRWHSQDRSGDILNEYVHMYANRFKNSLEVAQHLARQRASLLKRILSWQEVIYSEERLPGWLRDSLINIFAVLAQESFMLRSPDPDHWWGEEGFFCVNESLLTCSQQACIANDEFGEWPVNIFFPELAIKKLSAFKHYQKPNGQAPSTLGPKNEPDKPWYDQQLPVDGQVYVHMVDRYWQVTGDDTILEEYYPSVKAEMHFMNTVDEDGDGLVDVKGSNQYYDNWPPMAGAAIHISTYWLATLRIAERMAEKMGDTAFADECRSWIECGSLSIEEKLWNEELGSYLAYHQPETGVKSDSIISDQLIGQWFAHLHRLPRIFSEERVRTVLETIWNHNVKVAKYGVRNSIRPDLTTDTEGFYSGVQCPSYSSLVPAILMIYSGEAERGLELMRSIWHKMVMEKSMAWDMPCQLTPEGDAAYGLEYYHNTMLWTLPIAVLGQDLKTFCAPGGIVDRVIRAASKP